ncbi:hypothetical protein IWX85_002632 [Polaromonas sp. CG_9.11]|nr:hypothetical protein [Polaromonas sp. CG_9.11]
MKAPFHAVQIPQQNNFPNRASRLLPLPPGEGGGEGSPTPLFGGGFPLPAPSPQPSPTSGRGSKKTLQTKCACACPLREKRPIGNPGTQVNLWTANGPHFKPNQPPALLTYAPTAIKAGAKP